MTNHTKSALEIEQEILGEGRRLMPCGCVMRINEHAEGGARFEFPAVRCGGHQGGCPYVHDKVPND